MNEKKKSMEIMEQKNDKNRWTLTNRPFPTI